MERRKFTREFKLEAVKLIRERRVTVAQAAIWGLQGSSERLRSIQSHCGQFSTTRYPASSASAAPLNAIRFFGAIWLYSGSRAGDRSGFVGCR